MKKILLMLAKGGCSQNDIASILHVSKRDVSAAAKIIKEKELRFDDIVAMDASAIDDAFFPKTVRERNDAYLQPDMDALIERKKKNRKLTVKQFWGEHCESAVAQGKLSYSYQSFCEMFAQAAEKSGATKHFQHIPGEKVFIDWAGDTAKITDRITGKITKIYVLVIVLPFSGKFWAGGFTDMSQPSWHSGHMAAFEEFGGTPRMLVPDNCGTATDRGPIYVTLINKEYERFAEHYNCAVVPARVRKPRDKSHAESAVDLVEEWIIAPSNEMSFYSLDEFNEYCAKRVVWLNERAYSAKDGSRQSIFEEKEAEYLQPLPLTRYETCEWRKPKVSPDYHVTLDYMHYSVPYTLISHTIDAKLTSSKVYLYENGELLCEHPRLRGRKNQYSTYEDHMPPNHKEMDSPWSAKRFESWSAKIGPETEQVIARVLNSRQIVEQAFVPCRNILGLSKQYGPQLLERACAQANAIGAIPSYTSLKNAICALKAQDNYKHAVDTAQTVQLATEQHLVDRAKNAGRVRGADAYRRKGNTDAN